MITKERLEELVKQGATIYDIFKGDIYFVDLTMAKYYDVPKYIEYKNDYYNCNLTRSIQDLFETKEEAEWYLEFGNIKRTETLKLPTWEEFSTNSKNSCIFVDFFSKVRQLYKCDGEIYINSQYCGCLTKENYIEVCKFCKKLFLGEEV